VSDWFDWFLWAIGAASVAIAALVVFAAVEDSKRPDFTLKKDDWRCTRKETTYTLVGKVLVPHTKCMVYERIN
jgi:hypothetical protein